MKMKNTIYLFLIAALLLTALTATGKAAAGDTTRITAIEFGGDRNVWLDFPSEDQDFRRILMNYKIKCPCGEWDYIAYVFVDQFFKVDTLWNGDDYTIEKTRVYYSDSTTVTERYEIMRYITPYGNGLNVGEGFTYTIDVTDFEPLLRDSVFMRAPNGQEDVEITFDFIEGTPPRDVVQIRKMWNDNNVTYDENFETVVDQKTIEFSEEEKGAMFRITQTGHGFGGTEENCAEFCRKMSYVKVNGAIADSNWVWRECGDIPLYPQGGTWLIDRTNWCPGMDVWPFDYEVTDFLDFGAENTIDFDMEYYDEEWTPGSNHRPKWVIQSYLITYGDPHFANDAAIDDIIQPSSKDEYLRLNPVCGGPVFVLRNNGSESLTSLNINYGIKDAEMAEYIWEGELNFRDTTHIYLPPFPIPEPGMEGTFVLQLSDPNGEPDEFAADNYAETPNTPVPAYFKEMVMELQTNNYADEQYFYYLRDEHGNVLYSKEVGEFQSNRKYLDTFNLENGCYEFIFGNALGYGLDFWFLREQLGSGYLNFNAHGRTLMTFKKDFGNYIYHQFRVITHPRIVTETDEINFGKVAIGESVTYDFEIMPENEAGIEIESIDIPFGQNKGFFIESIEPSLDQGSVFLAEGEKMTVRLKFEPPRDREAKAFMRIFSNDAIQSQISVTLIGNEAEVSVGKEIMSDFEISISGNPVSDAAFVNIESEYPIQAEITLFNSVGMKIMALYNGNTANAGTITLDASSLPAGAYYLRAVTSGGSKTIPVMIIK